MKYEDYWPSPDDEPHEHKPMPKWFWVFLVIASIYVVFSVGAMGYHDTIRAKEGELLWGAPADFLK